MTQAVRSEIVFGPFRLDRDNARLLRDGRPVALTPKAFDVLHFLASRPDRLVTKDELLSAVWPDVIVGDASVKVCVREVRKALDDDIKTPRYIETVHRRGYRFIAGIGAERAEAPAPVAAPVPAPAAREVGPPPAPVTPPPAAARRALVGRDAALSRLVSAQELARRGERQCVFVTGGPGSGKTALVEAFLDGLQGGGDAPPPLVLAGHCFEQFGTSEPYLPVWEAVGRLARERPTPALSAVLARYAAAHEPAASAPGAAPQGGAAHAAPREPRTMSERLLREMADAIESLAAGAGGGGAAAAPVILLLEDVHWADYSTLDLISALARRRAPARLMVLATYRPAEVLAGEHPLRAIAQGLIAAGLAREVALEFLDVPAVAQLLAARLPGARRQLPPAFAARLHQRTDGHPLFLVHLIDHLVEQGVLRESGGAWQLTGDASGSADDANAPWRAVLDTQVPGTVRAMIEAQLERLDADARRVLEAAAVAGVEFSAAGAAAALSGDPGEAASMAPDVVAVERACDELARRHRLLEARGLAEWPDGTAATHYRFAHELYHNVVYEQVPAARRARLHRAMGLRREAAWGERGGATEDAAELAVHFELGRDWPRATTYLRHAARAAARQYAHREAVHYLRRALAALERLPAAARAEHELDVLMSLAVNLQVTKGCASPEVREIHARALELCEQRGRTGDAGVRELFPVLWGVWVFHKVRSDLRRADEMARQLLAMAREAGDAALVVQAHQSMSVTALCRGDPATTAAQMDEAALVYDPARHAANTESFGQDPGVATLAFGGVALLLLGRPDEALAASARAVELGRRLGQPSSLALATHFAAMMQQFKGDAAETARRAAETIDLAADEGFSFWFAGGTVLRGWAKVVLAGPNAGAGPEEGLADIRRGIDRWLATGSRTYHTYHLGLLADALRRLGRTDEALPLLEEALAAAASYPEGLYEAELHRLKGCCLGAESRPDEARASFTTALDVARRQGAKWFERRAAAALAGAPCDGDDAPGAPPPPPPPPKRASRRSR